jgi:hypothetical protein
MEWQNISTAPKNTRVLVMTESGLVTVAEKVMVNRYTRFQWLWQDRTNLFTNISPAFWMPIPKKKPIEKKDK